MMPAQAKNNAGKLAWGSILIFLIFLTIPSGFAQPVSVMEKSGSEPWTVKPGENVVFPLYLFNNAQVSKENYRASIENLTISIRDNQQVLSRIPIYENQSFYSKAGFEISFELHKTWENDLPTEPLVPPRYPQDNLPPRQNRPSYVDGYVWDGNNYLPVRVIDVRISAPGNINPENYLFTFFFHKVNLSSGGGPSAGYGVEYVPNTSIEVEVPAKAKKRIPYHLPIPLIAAILGTILIISVIIWMRRSELR